MSETHEAVAVQTREAIFATTYPKINGLYKRDQKGRIIVGEFSRPEFGYLIDLPWQWTEKVDGTNIRLTYDGKIGGNEYMFVQGRTDKAQIPPKLLSACTTILKTAPLTDVFPDASPTESVVLYGEGYGAGIQKGGGDYRPDAGFVLFDVRVGSWWLSRENVEDVATKLGINVVPLVAACSIPQAEELVRHGQFASWWPGVERPEGLVGRPVVPLFTAKGDRITVKIKWKDYA